MINGSTSIDSAIGVAAGADADRMGARRDRYPACRSCDDAARPSPHDPSRVVMACPHWRGCDVETRRPHALLRPISVIVAGGSTTMAGSGHRRRAAAQLRAQRRLAQRGRYEDAPGAGQSLPHLAGAWAQSVRAMPGPPQPADGNPDHVAAIPLPRS